MQTLNTNEFNTRLTGDPEQLQSRVFVNGEATTTLVAGAYLEACVEWHDSYLLFLTDNIPHEDMLNIHLLNKKFDLLDSAVLGTMYSTGSFSDLQITGENTLTFRFIGGIDWTLELLTEPRFALPLFSDPKGVSRRFKFKHYFDIKGNPLPEA